MKAALNSLQRGPWALPAQGAARWLFVAYKALRGVVERAVTVEALFEDKRARPGHA